MFRIRVSSKAEKFIRKSESLLRKRLIKKIKTLLDNPIPSDAKKNPVQ